MRNQPYNILLNFKDKLFPVGLMTPIALFDFKNNNQNISD
jgi:hypothetical protein